MDNFVEEFLKNYEIEEEANNNKHRAPRLKTHEWFEILEFQNT